MNPKADCPDVTKFTPEQRLEAIKRRLDKRRDYFNAKMDRVIRQEMLKASPGEDLRAWMDSFAKGSGLDICCGNYLTDGSIGIDSAYDVLGNHFNFRGDNLAGFSADSFDYVVCNYADCFDSPLRFLNEWKRVLKPGGQTAFIVSNADCYGALDLPLNGKRQFLYTPHTMELFMYKLQWKSFKVQTHQTMILTWGIK